MLGPDQVASNWGAIASGYESSFEALSATYAETTAEVLAVGAEDRVLDVAAGTGAFALAAARRGSEVLATDFAEPMVARIRERAKDAKLDNLAARVMDGQNLELEDKSFDVVASVLGLIFFPDIPRGLSELHRVLRSGGRCGVVTWADPANLELMTGVMEAIKTVMPDFEAPTGQPTWARLAGAQDLETAMRDAGFLNVQISEVHAQLHIKDPEEFWSNFTRSSPPLAFLFSKLGDEVTARVGDTYMATLASESPDDAPAISATACIGLGYA